MVEDITADDLKEKCKDIQDKVDNQIQTLTNITEKVVSIKEIYDKKFDGLVAKFKEIEGKFISGEFEEKIFGELKNSNAKQKEMVEKVTNILERIKELAKDLQSLKQNHQDFFLFENKLDTLTKELSF